MVLSSFSCHRMRLCSARDVFWALSELSPSTACVQDGKICCQGDDTKKISERRKNNRMIKSYKDYLNYVEADRISSGMKNTIRNFLFEDVWAFQRKMRKLEYITNCQRNIILRLITAFQYRRLGRKLGFEIPINVFGPGLAIAHPGTIVINSATRIGANCKLHVCVNIGTSGGDDCAPRIGNNCYIGPGAKIFGCIQLGDNIAIGANAVVNKSFPEGNMTIGGVPAKKISNKTSEAHLVKGADVTCATSRNR